MVTLKRMQEIRRILSRLIFDKTYKQLTTKQSIKIGKIVKKVIIRENKKKKK